MKYGILTLYLSLSNTCGLLVERHHECLDASLWRIEVTLTGGESGYNASDRIPTQSFLTASQHVCSFRYLCCHPVCYKQVTSDIFSCLTTSGDGDGSFVILLDEHQTGIGRHSTRHLPHDYLVVNDICGDIGIYISNLREIENSVGRKCKCLNDCG